MTEEGIPRLIGAHVCDVHKAFLSVNKIAAAGNIIFFDTEGSYGQDKKTDERLLQERRGMYMLKLWARDGKPNQAFSSKVYGS